MGLCGAIDSRPAVLLIEPTELSQCWNGHGYPVERRRTDGLRGARRRSWGDACSLPESFLLVSSYGSRVVGPAASDPVRLEVWRPLGDFGW